MSWRPFRCNRRQAWNLCVFKDDIVELIRIGIETTIISLDRNDYHIQMTDPLKHFTAVIYLSCKILERFALQVVDPVIEFIQTGSTPFKDSAILAPKLADQPFWWKSNSTPSKSGSGLPDLD
jgi:hypothetical protein